MFFQNDINKRLVWLDALLPTLDLRNILLYSLNRECIGANQAQNL